MSFKFTLKDLAYIVVIALLCLFLYNTYQIPAPQQSGTSKPVCTRLVANEANDSTKKDPKYEISCADDL